MTELSASTPSPYPASSWVQHHRTPGRARLRLFCFPCAGSGASTYATWRRALPEDVEVCAIQPPGREERLREPGFDRLEPLLDALERELTPYLDLPFAFFGHSMGGLLGFELARRLQSRGGPVPEALLIAAYRSPQLGRSGPGIHALPDDAFIDELRRMGGTPEAVLRYDELIRLLLPVLRADFTICETYRYAGGEQLDCPISVYGGADDGQVPPQDLAPWEQLTRDSFTLEILPGDHFLPRSARAVLLERIAERLSAPAAGPASHGWLRRVG